MTRRSEKVAELQADIGDMRHPENSQPRSGDKPTGSKWAKYSLRNLGFAVGFVLVIALIVWLTYYHSHTYVVQSVLDGDTFIVTKWRQQLKIQLAGADAPEIHKNEPYAWQAQVYLEKRIRGRKIRLEFLDTARKLDYKNRMLCWAWVDGDNLSYMLVAKGLAKFSGAAEGDARTILAMLQSDAKQNGRGLWSAGTVSYQPRDDQF